MELVRGIVKVEWANLGEGWSGEYDPTDPEDENLLRFDVLKQENGEWVEVEDASYCTRVPATATPEQQQALLEILMNRFHDPVTAGESVKRLGEELSWICLDDLK